MPYCEHVKMSQNIEVGQGKLGAQLQMDTKFQNLFVLNPASSTQGSRNATLKLTTYYLFRNVHFCKYQALSSVNLIKCPYYSALSSTPLSTPHFLNFGLLMQSIHI